MNDARSPTTRCFVGLALDPENSAVLHARVKSVLDPADWKLHEPEDYHLTLCFLGSVATERSAVLRSNLAGALRGLAAPQLTVRSTGHFGEISAARVLWAGVSGSKADLARLVALREASAAAIAQSSLTFDSKGSFTPHLTVARPRRSTPLPRGFAELALDLDWRAGEAALFGSVPLAHPHYPVLESFALS